jgi:hypothetical protein
LILARDAPVRPTIVSGLQRPRGISARFESAHAYLSPAARSDRNKASIAVIVNTPNGPTIRNDHRFLQWLLGVFSFSLGIFGVLFTLILFGRNGCACNQRIHFVCAQFAHPREPPRDYLDRIPMPLQKLCSLNARLSKQAIAPAE